MEKKKVVVRHRQNSIEIPYYQFGKPSSYGDIFLTAGIHGDEVNGIHALNSILKWFHRESIEQQLKGRVLIFPVLNPTAFIKRRRFVPEDSRDLNRAFGRDRDSISSKMADGLAEIFKECFMGIDFHDAGMGADLIPHTRIHLADELDCVSCSRSLAQIFGTKYILERNGVKSMMAVFMNDVYNTPVITVEMGGGRLIHPASGEIAHKGVLNVLQANRFLDGEFQLPPEQFVVRHRDILVSKRTGILQFEVEIGDQVVEGDLVASILDPVEGVHLPIVASKSGVIFSRWPDNHIHKGGTVVSIVCLEAGVNRDVIEMENYVVKPYDL